MVFEADLRFGKLARRVCDGGLRRVWKSRVMTRTECECGGETVLRDW